MVSNEETAMVGLNEIGSAFVFGVDLLEQFHHNLTLPQWLAPLGGGGLLARLLRLLPKIQQGSISAAALGYLLMALLIFNTIVLFTLAQLPGQSAIPASASSLRSGFILLGLFGTGLWVIFRELTKVTKVLETPCKNIWQWLTRDRSATRSQAPQMPTLQLSPTQAIQYDIQSFAIASQRH
jgi:hypothetical protein